MVLGGEDPIRFNRAWDCLATVSPQPIFTQEQLQREMEWLQSMEQARHPLMGRRPAEDPSWGLPQENPRWGSNAMAQKIEEQSTYKRLEEQRAREVEQEKEADRLIERIDMHYPGLGHVWGAFRQRCGSSVSGFSTRAAAEMLSTVVQRMVAHQEEQRAKFTHDHAELLDLCQRLIRTFDGAQDVMDMQAAIEELDSMVYEIDKESDG